MKRYFTVLFNFLLFLSVESYAQKFTWHLFNSKTKEPIPFVAVRLGHTNSGLVADLDGKFELDTKLLSNGRISFLEFSCLGFVPKKINLPTSDNVILLEPEDKILNAIDVKPDNEKINLILKEAIRKKPQNNPDKFDNYSCKVYYKMIADAEVQRISGEINPKDNEIANFLKGQHLMMSETYSLRAWRKPDKLQEDIIATKFSGFKNPMFTTLVTDILPFHSYSDFLAIYGKDYHNPLSNGFEKYYYFNLSDEILQGADTLWVISFFPKGHNANELKGKLYINSDGYAISSFVAIAIDTILKLETKLEQEYCKILSNGGQSRWFPKHLNYTISWQQKSKQKALYMKMSGTSVIDSISFVENRDWNFDKSHTVRMLATATQNSDSFWNLYRPFILDEKASKTYKVMDSLGERRHFDKILFYFSKSPELKMPLVFFDIDLKKFFTYNNYEGVRLGLGAQTNEKISKCVSLGGYGCYGFTDRAWKYGVYTELYGDKYKELVFKLSYYNDLTDPGRIKLNPDLDKNYLNSYLLWRVDNLKSYSASLKKKFGYWNFELVGSRSEVLPKYDYAFLSEGKTYRSFNFREVTSNIRYAFGEQRTPLWGYYYSTGSKFPICYVQLKIGNLDSGSLQTTYIQAVTAFTWQKHINRMGLEQILIECGKSWSREPLPLTKLFAGTGYSYTSNSFEPSVYAFGGLVTITPYQYYSDVFVNLILCHEFDRKFINKNFGREELCVAPNLCFQYSVLYGNLKNRGAQQNIVYSVPDDTYNEFGMLLKSLIKKKYMNICYFAIDVGYFYHINTVLDFNKSGRIVIGGRLEL